LENGIFNCRYRKKIIVVDHIAVGGVLTLFLACLSQVPVEPSGQAGGYQQIHAPQPRIQQIEPEFNQGVGQNDFLHQPEQEGLLFLENQLNLPRLDDLQQQLGRDLIEIQRRANRPQPRPQVQPQHAFVRRNAPLDVPDYPET